MSLVRKLCRYMMENIKQIAYTTSTNPKRYFKLIEKKGKKTCVAIRETWHQTNRSSVHRRRSPYSIPKHRSRQYSLFPDSWVARNSTKFSTAYSQATNYTNGNFWLLYLMLESFFVQHFIPGWGNWTVKYQVLWMSDFNYS